MAMAGGLVGQIKRLTGWDEATKLGQGFMFFGMAGAAGLTIKFVIDLVSSVI